MLEKRGDFQANVSIGSGVNIQAAYSPIKYFTIAGNTLLAHDKWFRNNNYRDHRAFEGAAGFYKPGNVIFEVLAGYGHGNGFAHDAHGAAILGDRFFETFEGFYNKQFIQATVAWHVHPQMQMALTARVADVQFTSFNYTNNGQVMVPPFKTNGIFYEPCATFKAYPVRTEPRFLIFAQSGLNIDLFDAETKYYNTIYTNIGIGLRLERKTFAHAQ